MWSGVDPDVELYASGVVVDDDGDFSGGQALNDGARRLERRLPLLLAVLTAGLGRLGRLVGVAGACCRGLDTAFPVDPGDGLSHFW